MSSGMNTEQAKEYAKTMTYREAVSNIRHAKGIKYRKATRIKLRELAEIADRLDRKTESIIEVYNDNADKENWQCITTKPIDDEPQTEPLPKVINGVKIADAVEWADKWLEDNPVSEMWNMIRTLRDATEWQGESHMDLLVTEYPQDGEVYLIGRDKTEAVVMAYDTYKELTEPQTDCKMPYKDCEDCETHLKAQYGNCNKCRWYGDKQVCGRCRSRNLYAPKDESQTTSTPYKVDTSSICKI